MNKTLLKKQSQNPSYAASSKLEEALREDLTIGTSRLTRLTPNALEGEGPVGNFSYSEMGNLPYRQVVRRGKNGSLTLAENVASVRFTAYNAKGHFLPDQLSQEQLETITEIRIEIAIHKATESPDAMINDGIHGVDLDGDPGNGVAKIHSRQFVMKLE